MRGYHRILGVMSLFSRRMELSTVKIMYLGSSQSLLSSVERQQVLSFPTILQKNMSLSPQHHRGAVSNIRLAKSSPPPRPAHPQSWATQGLADFDT
jgi:hypothetical protein